MVSPNKDDSKPEVEVTPTEDLMREHGVEMRILLIYKDIIKRLRGEKAYDQLLVGSVAYSAADISHSFIEEYHQRLEEDYIFPRFEKAGLYTELVHTLLEQHNAARRLTNSILMLSASEESYYYHSRLQLVRLLSLYIRMYEPHTAREDTMLFPAFHSLVSREEFQQLGDRFEEIEKQKFGENGFERIVNEVAQLEQALDIYDLNKFTQY